MSNIFDLTKKQRLDMQMAGLSPLNPEHVAQYIQSGGNVKKSQKESIQRIKTLVGEEAFSNVSLGHRDSWGSGNTYSNSNNVDDIREQLANDMNDYTQKGIKQNLMESLEDLNSPIPQNTKQSQSVKEIAALGYSNTIAYLNSFIRNLKNPSTASRMEIYKTLQVCLQKEQTYKTNPNALKAYQQGCKKAEIDMYQKLKK